MKLTEDNTLLVVYTHRAMSSIMVDSISDIVPGICYYLYKIKADHIITTNISNPSRQLNQYSYSLGLRGNLI